nr:MAG TPA: Putative regulatory protein binding pocket, HTH-MOTIF, DNA [Caudoviricetes sp.]
MTIFFVLFRCRITGDEQPEIVMNQNWNCCWTQARGLAATMNEAAKRAGVKHEYYIAQFSRVE